jgi:FkbM family methyltransferase
MVVAERAGVEEAQAAIATTILLCAYRSLTVETAECLDVMRNRGWSYQIGRGDALIQRVRSRVVTQWYRNTNEDVFLMIDDDIVFPAEGAESVVALAREKRSIAVGAYPVRDGGHLACRGFPGQEIIFGDSRPPVEIQWPATGFMAVHRDVLDAMTRDLPLCGRNAENPLHALYPFFDTFWIETENDTEYLSEDYAFGERARRLGFKVWLDPSVILYHLGGYPYNVHNMPTARHFERPEEADNPPEEVITTGDGFKLALDPRDDFICQALRQSGYWDKGTRDAIVDYLKPGWTFLDLGAHIGYYSLLAASRGNPVIAVEPMPRAAGLLRKSVGLNESALNIRLEQCVVAPSSGEAIMQAVAGNTGAAHRLEHETDEPTFSIEARSLPDILAGVWPEMVKLDIEGDEYRVLESCPELLEHAQVVICEVCEHHLRRNSGVGAAELKGLLEAAGFRLVEIARRPTYSDWLGVKE